MAESVTDRLGVVPFGAAEDPIIGNFLLYPRRTVLEALRRLFVQEDLIVPIDASGSPTQRNPFLLKLTENGAIARDSRVVLADFGSTTLMKEETRPRVIVEREGGQFSTGGFGQQNASQPTGWGAPKRSSDVFETGLQIRCVGRHKYESEGLAWIVSFALWSFRDVIKKRSDLFHVGQPQIGPTVPEKADAEVEQYVTTINMRMTQTINWELSRINATVLADICVQMSEEF